MSREVLARVRMKLPGAGATPAPPVGSILGQRGVALMEFCKAFNAKTADRKGQIVPVVITIYTDKKFDFVLKGAPTTDMLRDAAKIKKGAKATGKETVGTISRASIEEIAKIKMPDFNAWNLDSAIKMVAGSARSMGLTIVD